MGTSSIAAMPFSITPKPMAPKVQRTRLFYSGSDLSYRARREAQGGNKADELTMAVAEAGLEGYRSMIKVEFILKMAVAVKAANIIRQHVSPQRSNCPLHRQTVRSTTRETVKTPTEKLQRQRHTDEPFNTEPIHLSCHDKNTIQKVYTSRSRFFERKIGVKLLSQLCRWWQRVQIAVRRSFTFIVSVQKDAGQEGSKYAAESIGEKG
jgi:hypothetical protein